MTALRAGERHAALAELREVLADRLLNPETPATAVPGLSKQLRDVLAELDRVTPAKGTPVDELSSRRKKRRADVPPDAAGGEQRR